MISIVIPTRNRGDAFKRALNSALNQTIQTEIIVSDHASTDGTMEYVRDLNDDRIRYIRQDESINITWNWLLGFMRSEGDWIKYVFDDDWLEPNCCERLLSVADEETTVSQCGARFAWTGEQVYNTWNRSIDIASAVRMGMLSVSPVTALIRRDALLYSWGLMRRLSPRAFDSGVGPNVLMVYASVVKSPQRMAFTPDVLCHLDDLPGEHMSLTRRLRENDPATLNDCHNEAYDLLDSLP